MRVTVGVSMGLQWNWIWKIQNPQGLQDHIRKGVRGREWLSESGFKRVDVLRVGALHKGVQHDPWVVQSLKDCSVFF